MPKTRSQIAAELGISTTTLWRKLKKAPFKLSSGLIYSYEEQLIRDFIERGMCQVEFQIMGRNDPQ